MTMISRRINAVVLCGGLSSRMGTAKHLLPSFEGPPMYIHLLTQMAALEPPVQNLFVSVRGPEVDGKLERIFVEGRSVGLVYDTPSSSSTGNISDIGPAAGLLAAYRHDPNCTWLVIACDYPLITRSELQRLLDNYDGRLICFKNAEGFAEPLIGLWIPEALERLSYNVENGKTGPKTVVEDMNSKLVFPKDSRCLFNANTMQQWESAMKLGQEMFES